MGKDIDGLESSIDDRLEDLDRLIRRKYISLPGSLNIFDFAITSQYLTLDILTQIAFGEHFGYLETDSDVYGFISTIRKFIGVVELQMNHPWFAFLTRNKLSLALLGPKPTDKSGIGKMMG